MPMDLSLLWEAAKEGNLKLLKRELSKPGLDLELCDCLQRTPLVVAAKYDHLDCVRELLLAGANPDHTAFLGKPLDYARNPLIKQMLKEALAARARGQTWIPDGGVSKMTTNKKKKKKNKKVAPARSSGDANLSCLPQSSLETKNEADGMISESYNFPNKGTDNEPSQIPKACRYFGMGHCRHGDACQFLHNGTGAKSGSGATSSTGNNLKADHAMAAATGSYSSEEEDIDELDDRMQNIQFTPNDLDEILYQGVKPWDSDASDVRDPIDTDDATRNESCSIQNKPTKIPKACRYFAKGHCRYGNACWFLHNRTEAVAGSSATGYTGNKLKTYSATKAATDSYSSEGKDTDESEERMENFGFTHDEIEELLCQGVKPWDPDAWDVLAALEADYY